MMAADFAAMRPGNEAHAATLDCGGVERHPTGDGPVVEVRVPITLILMPMNMVRPSRRLPDHVPPAFELFGQRRQELRRELASIAPEGRVLECRKVRFRHDELRLRGGARAIDRVNHVADEARLHMNAGG